MVRNERASGDGVRDVAYLRQVAGLLLDRQRLDAPDPEVQPPGEYANRLDLLHLGIIALFAPKRVGERSTAFERETLPELRRADRHQTS
jgi:hypothetical protein